MTQIEYVPVPPDPLGLDPLALPEPLLEPLEEPDVDPDPEAVPEPEHDVEPLPVVCAVASARHG